MESYKFTAPLIFCLREKSTDLRNSIKESINTSWLLYRLWQSSVLPSYYFELKTKHTGIWEGLSKSCSGFSVPLTLLGQALWTLLLKCKKVRLGVCCKESASTTLTQELHTRGVERKTQRDSPSQKYCVGAKKSYKIFWPARQAKLWSLWLFQLDSNALLPLNSPFTFSIKRITGSSLFQRLIKGAPAEQNCNTKPCWLKMGSVH